MCTRHRGPKLAVGLQRLNKITSESCCATFTLSTDLLLFRSGDQRAPWSRKWVMSLINISSISTKPTRSFLSHIGGFTELTPGRGSKTLCGETSSFHSTCPSLSCQDDLLINSILFYVIFDLNIKAEECQGTSASDKKVLLLKKRRFADDVIVCVFRVTNA